MSPYMVPENHQEIFSTQWNQGEILVYFGTIYMEHPVHLLQVSQSQRSQGSQRAAASQNRKQMFESDSDD